MIMDFLKMKISLGKGIGYILQKFPEPEHDFECWLNQKEWEELITSIRKSRVGLN